MKQPITMFLLAIALVLPMLVVTCAPASKPVPSTAPLAIPEPESLSVFIPADNTSESLPESQPTEPSTSLEMAGTDKSTSAFIDDSRVEEPVRLTASPANPDDIAHIFPLGLMSGAHITPVDHQYYYWNELQVPLERYPVYSPTDGYVVNVQFLDNDYIVFIEHSPDMQTEFIHLEKLVGPLADIDGKVSWSKPMYVRVPVKAGEMIALDGGTNGFDFSVHDYSMTLVGFANPNSYVVEPWKVHTADPYDYFVEPVLSQLLAKNVRQIEPLGGKIDYDIQGRLIGNWFVEDSNGYAGLKRASEPIKPDQQIGYWNTHLAIAPDPIDPTAIIVSIGWFDGKTAQLAIKDINPSPEDVSVETGLVEYELVDWQYVYGEKLEPWHGITRKAEKDIRVMAGTHIKGLVLFQMLGNERLKMEVFPGMTIAEVSSFTGNARVYVR
ncbi:hypothetical protein ACFLXD_04100 [Chloroflexota bacterium]